MLISGKSGTMLPITACSSTGQFCQDGSWHGSGGCAPPRVRFSATSTSPRQPSIQPAPKAPRHRRAQRQRDCAARAAAAAMARHQPQGFQHFVEAHRDPRRHIAARGRGRLRTCSCSIRRAGLIAAQIERLTAGAAGHAGQTQCAPASAASPRRCRESGPASRRVRRRSRAGARTSASMRLALRERSRRCRARQVARACRPAPRSPSASAGRRHSAAARAASLRAGAKTAPGRRRNPHRCPARPDRPGDWRPVRVPAAARAASARAPAAAAPRSASQRHAIGPGVGHGADRRDTRAGQPRGRRADRSSVKRRSTPLCM